MAEPNKADELQTEIKAQSQSITDMQKQYGQIGSEMLQTLDTQVNILKKEKERLQSEIQLKQNLQLKEKLRRKKYGDNIVIEMHDIKTNV